MRTPALRLLLVGLAGAVAALVACAPSAGSGALTVYSSRTQSLVQPLLEQFARESGIDVDVRYDTTASLVATLREEGQNSPADVVYMGESSGLAALSQADMLATLQPDILERVDPRFRSSRGTWVGTSGRAKTVVYNTRTIDPARDLPASILEFTDPKWRGRIGWAPTHGEWQLTVTAIRLAHGDEVARRWIEGIRANEPRTYVNLISIVQAAADGEIDVGFVNHYYVPRMVAQRGADYGARNAYLGGGDAGALVDLAGVGVLRSARNEAAARRFVEYMLSQPAQQYFAVETFEYPLAAGVAPSGELPPLSTLNPPNIDPDRLADLQGTVRLLRETGVIP